MLDRQSAGRVSESREGSKVTGGGSGLGTELTIYTSARERVKVGGLNEHIC